MTAPKGFKRVGWMPFSSKKHGLAEKGAWIHFTKRTRRDVRSIWHGKLPDGVKIIPVYFSEEDVK